MKIWAELI